MVGLSASPLGAQQQTPTVHKVEIKSFVFVPQKLDIRVGDTVEWTNTDLAPHTATEVNKSWDTGGLRNGATGRITFMASGTMSYFCIYHPHMKGSVIVAP